ncbi:uncharacterized protein LOC119111230 [Pollicipes pollicipes]|uniref:uncharacterized protein LOC119111230 n=1 Tax=Pollicipes pollicipes TaxID=41117 RepID=UPI001884F12F|nr:uncharacterized protein LOC119111230 [Pollicipes pollicipes]
MNQESVASYLIDACHERKALGVPHEVNALCNVPPCLSLRPDKHQPPNNIAILPDNYGSKYVPVQPSDDELYAAYMTDVEHLQESLTKQMQENNEILERNGAITAWQNRSADSPGRAGSAELSIDSPAADTDRVPMTPTLEHGRRSPDTEADTPAAVREASSKSGRRAVDDESRLVSIDTVYFVPGTPPPVGRTPVLLSCVPRDSDLPRDPDLGEPVAPTARSPGEAATTASPDRGESFASAALATGEGVCSPAQAGLDLRELSDAVFPREGAAVENRAIARPKRASDARMDTMWAWEVTKSGTLPTENGRDSLRGVKCVSTGGRNPDARSRLLMPPASPDGYVAQLISRHSQGGVDDSAVMPKETMWQTLFPPTEICLEERKKMLEIGKTSDMKPKAQPVVRVHDEGRVVRLRRMYEQLSESARRASEHRSDGSLFDSRGSSRSMVDLAEPQRRAQGELNASLFGTREKSRSSAELARPLAAARTPAPLEPPAEEEHGADEQDRAVAAAARRQAVDRSLSCSDAGRPVRVGRLLSCWELSNLSTDANHARFEAIQRFFEGLREGRICSGGGGAAARGRGYSRAA